MPPISKRPNLRTNIQEHSNVISSFSSEKYDQYFETQTGKKFTVYHTNWSTYGRNFQVKDLQMDKVPEISYAFFNLDASGNIKSGDTYSDFDKRFLKPEDGVQPLDDWNSQEPYYGNFGQFLKLKKAGKKFNLTLSIGGWSWSKYFSDAVLLQNQQTFINSILTIVNKYPIFCGVSLDWEYVTSDGKNWGNEGNIARPEDADNFILFCKRLRETFNQNGKSHYTISVCCSARPNMPKNMKARQLEPYIDEFHIMTYDHADGNWGEKTTAHHTNLKKTSYSSFSVEEAVDAYLAEGLPSTKIMIGAAYYSRGFSNTDGPGKPASGGSPDKSWESGVVDYKALPLPGAKEYWDPESLAPYSYDPVKRIYNSYDNVNSIYYKCCYVWQKNLKGILIWESSGDFPSNHPRNLTNALYNYLIAGDPRSMLPPPLPPLQNGSPAPYPQLPNTNIPLPPKPVQPQPVQPQPVQPQPVQPQPVQPQPVQPQPVQPNLPNYSPISLFPPNLFEGLLKGKKIRIVTEITYE